MSNAEKPEAQPRKMRRRQKRGSLMIVAVLLAGSGVIRLGDGAGRAFARATEPASKSAQPAPAENCAPEADAMALLEALRVREKRVNEREATLESRAQALHLAEKQVDEKIAKLVAAEDALSKTITVADKAADEDVARLVTLYENMKPKEAAPLFEEMAPEFAAGFLARMRPDTAAAVLSGLEPKTAYSISVLMAGRNANAPKN